MSTFGELRISGLGARNNDNTYPTATDVAGERHKLSFKKLLLFGDNNFVMPNVSIGPALGSFPTAAGFTDKGNNL